jgi:2-polyprenyl-3-methyl-5-hydroxy-6-metoxy-1,4-benzoquinol methylase
MTSHQSKLLGTRHLYDAKYYLTACEGYNCNIDILSPRLQSVYNAALPHLKGVVLDAGCGRGELTIRAARLEAVQQVHSIDYSPDAIRILLDNLSKEDTTTTDKVHIHMDTVDTFLSYTNVSYNCVLLSDVVEHIPFVAAQALIKSLSLITKTIIVSTPISQAHPNECHLWLARSEVDILQMAPDFRVINHGYAGSGEDYIFELSIG